MERDRWSSKTVFLFAAIGSAVGLGNLWRFPYLAHKFGGGAFLLPYLIALFTMGIPLLIMEFGLGQYFQRGIIAGMHKINPRLRGIGFTAVFTGFVVVVYYAAIMAWAMVYLVDSFALELPWKADPERHFYQHNLELSSGIEVMGGLNWPLFASLALVWIIIYFCVWKGVKSAGKVVVYTMPLPILFLIILFFRGITLDGAWEGIVHYVNPNFSLLLDSEIWLAAASQIFFTISLGFGIMVAYASYNDKKMDIVKSALITSLTNSGISIFAGFVVFSVLGYMATLNEVPITEVVASGPGLAFIAFPKALATLPFAWLFSALFFLMLLSLGIDSAFSLVEAVNTCFLDRFPSLKKEYLALFICLISFILGGLFVTRAGLFFLDLYDHFVTTYGLVLVGILECLAIGWVFKAENMRLYVNSVSKRQLGRSWNFCIKYFIPIILLVLMIKQFLGEIESNYGGYPNWAIHSAWALTLFPFLVTLFLVFKPSYAENTNTAKKVFTGK